YKKLSPTPDKFETFVKYVIQMDIKPYDFGAAKLKATKAPMLFIHGDADGVQLDHIAEMFRLKGDEIFGDMRPRSESRLAILPNTTHITLMDKLGFLPTFGDSLRRHIMGSLGPLRWGGRGLPSRDSFLCVHDVGPDGAARTCRTRS